MSSMADTFVSTRITAYLSHSPFTLIVVRCIQPIPISDGIYNEASTENKNNDSYLSLYLYKGTYLYIYKDIELMF